MTVEVVVREIKDEGTDTVQDPPPSWSEHVLSGFVSEGGSRSCACVEGLQRDVRWTTTFSAQWYPLETTSLWNLS